MLADPLTQLHADETKLRCGLSDDSVTYPAMAGAINPYEDGHAAE